MLRGFFSLFFFFGVCPVSPRGSGAVPAVHKSLVTFEARLAIVRGIFAACLEYGAETKYYESLALVIYVRGNGG